MKNITPHDFSIRNSFVILIPYSTILIKQNVKILRIIWINRNDLPISNRMLLSTANIWHMDQIY